MFMIVVELVQTSLKIFYEVNVRCISRIFKDAAWIAIFFGKHTYKGFDFFNGAFLYFSFICHKFKYVIIW